MHVFSSKIMAAKDDVTLAHRADGSVGVISAEEKIRSGAVHSQ